MPGDNTPFEQAQGLSGEDRRLAERGYPLPDPLPPGPPGSGVSPPNQGLVVFPHHESYLATWNTQSGVYRYTYDEAVRHSRKNADAYRKDPVVYEALRARQMPVAGLTWNISPRNDLDPADIEHAKKVRTAAEDTPNLQQLLMYLQEALWFGRYGSSLVYDWDWSEGYRRAVVRQHWPIDGDKLVFRYTGEVGITVGGQFNGSWIPTDRGRAHICTPEERQLLIVHEHEREDAGYYNAEMAGRVHGVGVRDRLYWFLYMKQRVLAWLMEYLEKVGAGGIWVFYFESGNDASLAEVKNFAEKANKNTAFLFPRYADGKSGPGVERKEPTLAGADLLSQLITRYFDTIIRRLILGQSLSAEAGSTGLGSGVSDFHQETLNRIIKYDARNLQETLTRDFVKVLSRHIDPARRPPRWEFEVDRPNAAEHLEAASHFFEMGGDLDEDGLRSVLGLSKPRPGARILSKQQLLMQQSNPQLGMPGMIGQPVQTPMGPSMGGMPMGGLPGTLNPIMAALLGGQ